MQKQQHLLDGVQQWGEQICVIVGPLSLKDPHQSLQSHSSIHTELGEQAQTAVDLPDTDRFLYWELTSTSNWFHCFGLKYQPVVLHEDQVPDLNQVRIVSIDQSCGVTTPHMVIVDLSAGTAGTRVPHLPKIVFQAKSQ